MALDIGNKKSSAEETTQNVSGKARGVTGKRNQYTESGSISVGSKGNYRESGSFDAGTKNSNNLGTQFTGVQGGITINDTGGETAIALLDKLGSLVPAPGPSQSIPTPPVLPPSPYSGPSVMTDASGSATKEKKADDAGGTVAAGFGVGTFLIIGVALWFLFRKK